MPDDVVQPQVGPECSSNAFDQDRELMNKLTQAMEELRTAIHTQNDTNVRLHQENINRISNEQANKPYDAAQDAVHRTRDAQNLGEENKAWIDELVKKLHDLHFAGTRFVDEKVSHLANQLDRMGQQYFNKTGQMAAGMLGGENPMAEAALTGFFTNIGRLGTGLATAGLAAEGLAASFAGLAGAAVVLVGIFGIFEAFKAFNENIDFERNLLKTNPAGFDSIRGSVADVGTLRQAKSEMRMNLAYGHTDSDMDRYLGAAMGLRSKDASFREIQNMGYTMGLLEDLGVSTDTSKKVGLGMSKELGLNLGQTEYAMLSLATTAKNNAYDIGAYMERITDLTKKFRYLGMTVLDIDKVFSTFANTTMVDGQKLGYEGAMQATELQLSMRQRLSMGQAAYIAMTTGSGLMTRDSMGFHGGSNLGQLARSGPAGSMLAAAYMRGGNVPGAYTAASGFYNDMVDRMMSGGAYSNLSGGQRQDMRYLLTAQAMGMSDQYIGGDKAVIALVQKVANRKPMTDAEFGKRIKELAPKPIDQLIKDFSAEFRELTEEGHQILRKYNEFFRPWTEIWEKIRDLLASVFLPLVENIMLWTATIGEFILGIGKYGASPGGISHAGRDAIGKYNEMAEFMRDIHKEGALQGYDKIRQDTGRAISNSFGGVVKNAKSRFDAFIGPLLNSEGGLANHPSDRGGLTKFGISQRSYPNLDIRNLTKEQAKDIYYRNYYLGSGAHKIADPRTAEMHWDAAINHGVGAAKNLLRKSGGDYNRYVNARYQYYDDIVRRDPSQRVFYKGWMNRMANLKKTIASHQGLDEMIARNKGKTVPKKELLGGPNAVMKASKYNPATGTYIVDGKPIKIVVEHHSIIEAFTKGGRKQVSRKITQKQINKGHNTT